MGTVPTPTPPPPARRLDRHRVRSAWRAFARWGDRALPRPWQRWALAVGVIVLAALPMVLRYLVLWPLDQWQVDVDVYRQAGVSILHGRPIYSAMTEPPQLLPFTYPPFAAFLAVPLALVPFGVAGWLWTAAQVAATAAIVWYAGTDRKSVV